jgi:hypothetical protein
VSLGREKGLVDLRLTDKEAAKDAHLDLADLKKRLEGKGVFSNQDQREGARLLIEQFAVEHQVHGRQLLEDEELSQEEVDEK